MRAEVTYNEYGEPSKFKVIRNQTRKVHGTMDGSTAVIMSLNPHEGEDLVYGYDVRACWEFLEALPFVQGVVLELPEEED